MNQLVNPSIVLDSHPQGAHPYCKDFNPKLVVAGTAGR